jgi:hypothetical protein
MARYRAADARLAAASARIKAGDCSAVSEWKRALGAVHAILHRSQQQTYPYTCNVNVKYPSPPRCKETRTAKKDTPSKDVPSKQDVPDQPKAAASKSGSCSDITGTDSGSGPSNCTTSSGTPQSVAGQLTKAQSYMQAAQTVKDSDPSYNGWTAAAAQFRKAAAAFELAGEAARAMAANAQAQTLEDGLKIANRMAAPSQGASNGAAASPASDPASEPAPVAVANADSGSTSFNIPTPCQDLTGKYGCKDDGAIPIPLQPRLSEGETQRLNKPRPWQPGGVAPDVQAEILALAATLLAKQEDSPDRLYILRALQRRLADNRVRVKPKDIVCQQPAKIVGQRKPDLALRWHPYHIKKEAIDRSHLCDGVAEGEARDSCRESKYGQAVMWAEPELAGQCRGAGGANHDVDAVAECAKNKFLNAWNNNNQGIVSAPTPDSLIMPVTCTAPVPGSKQKSLRDRLIEALAKRAAGQISDVDDDDGETQPPAAETTVAAATPPPPPAIDDDEAYCDYMARELVRGELTPGDATALPPGCKATIAAAEALKTKQLADGNRPFSMSAADTDEEIRKLRGVPPTPASAPKETKDATDTDTKDSIKPK